MKTSTAFYFLALAASAASSPLAELEDRTFFPPGCSTDNKVLIIGGLDQQFCSAYLQPTSTVTAVNTVLNTAFVRPNFSFDLQRSSWNELPPANIFNCRQQQPQPKQSLSPAPRLLFHLLSVVFLVSQRLMHPPPSSTTTDPLLWSSVRHSVFRLQPKLLPLALLSVHAMLEAVSQNSRAEMEITDFRSECRSCSH